MDKLNTFEQLFRSGYKKQFLIAYRLTHDKQASEDLVHDVYLHYWENQEKIIINGSAESYITKAVWNRSLNYLRDRKITIDVNDPKFEAMIEPLPETDKLMGMDREVLRKLIKNGLHDLPPQCRAIFMLCRNEKMKYAEVAELLNLSVKTVEKQMSIAIKKINLKLHTDLKLFFQDTLLSILVILFLTTLN